MDRAALDGSGVPLRVVLVCGLAQDAVDAAALAVIAERRGNALAYRVVIEGESPVIMRTHLRDGVCVSQDPMATTHGCIACAVRDDVLATLSGWADDGDDSLVTVVLPAGATPSCIVDPVDLTFVARTGGFGFPDEEDPHAQITCVVAAVDGTRLVAQVESDQETGESGIAAGAFGTRPLAELVLETLRCADLVVLDGLGLSDDPATARTLELVGHVAPHARAVRAGLTSRIADVSAEAIHDPTRTSLRHEPVATPPAGGRGRFGVATEAWATRRPLHPVRLMDSLERLATEAVALEGAVWLANRPHEVVRMAVAGGAASITTVDGWLAEAPASEWASATPWRRVQAELAWDPYYGDRECRVVALCIGDGGELDAVLETLDRCALTDEELAAGPESWAELADPFAPWLGDPWTAQPEVAADPTDCDGVHDHERVAVQLESGVVVDAEEEGR
jgi:G3E family GTPase